MIIDLPLTPEEEARLNSEAKRSGLSVAELLKHYAFRRLPPTPKDAEEKLDAYLLRLQEQDGGELGPDISIQELFARWEEEDALMTNEEREANARLWEEIERGLIEHRGLYLRSSDECSSF